MILLNIWFRSESTHLHVLSAMNCIRPQSEADPALIAALKPIAGRNVGATSKPMMPRTMTTVTERGPPELTTTA
jgi:hypothetical protein